MNHTPRPTHRQRRVGLPAARAAAAMVAAVTIAACGSSSLGSSTAGHRINPSQAEAQQDTVNFARCMRSHGVPRFPDDLDLQNVPGIDPASPAFRTAQSACRWMLPVKHAPSGRPSAHAYAQLLHWAKCMRTHGVSALPDPKPNPPPSGSDTYGTLMGDGGYWVGIPIGIDAHSPAFVRMATACGESPSANGG